jgi:hypothetical protein
MVQVHEGRLSLRADQLFWHTSERKKARRAAAASHSRPLLREVSDARSEQSSEVRKLRWCLGQRVALPRSEISGVSVFFQGQESIGCREASRLAEAGKALKVLKPMSGCGMKQSRKGA